MRDIKTLTKNIKDKIQELVERGSDLDEIFYEMRDEEELKWENTQTLDIDKSAISKSLKFRFLIALQMGEGRKKNTEIQTYNVDFLVD